MTTKDSSIPWSKYDLFGLAILLGMLSFWLWTVAQRITYPYDLEWMEGGMLIHALRVKESLGLYVEPSADFIPYIYPPLYPWLLAHLSSIFSLGYPLGRGVSVVGTLMATTAIIVALRNEGVSRSVAFLSGAIFLSTFEDSGTFFDLTRADSLMLGLLGWAVVLARMGSLRWAGLLCWLAFLTKHNAAIVGIPVVLWIGKEHGVQKAMQFALWSALPALLSIGFLQMTTNGLFLTYLLDVPSHHPIVAYRFMWLSEYEMWLSMPIIVTILAIFGIVNRWKKGKFQGVIWFLSIVGFTTLCSMNLGDFPKILGSSKNGMVPFAIFVWVLAIVAWMDKRLFVTAKNPSDNEERSGLHLWWGIALVLVFFSALMRGHHGGFTNVLMPGIWCIGFSGRIWNLGTVKVSSNG